MLPPSLALGWTIWRQHRWVLLPGLGYMIAVAAVSAVLPDLLTPSVGASVFGILVMPLLGFAVCLLIVFSCASETALDGRESCFLPGLLRLPVSTGALAGWPIAYGSAAMALLWLAGAWFILRPWLSLWDAMVPLWWPGMLAVASLAWVQALLWLPVGLPWIRVLLITAVLPALITVASHSHTSGASEGLRVSMFAAMAGIGWMIGFQGVRQARRGDVPDWRWIFRSLGQIARLVPQRRMPFTSAARAQVWFEWRRSGNSLPLMTGLVLPFVLLFLTLGKNDVMPTMQPLLSALAVPVFLATIAGTTTSGKNPWAKDYYGLAPFTATLPVSTAVLVGAKLIAAALSTVAAWALVAVVVPMAVLLTGNLEEVQGWWQQVLNELGPVKLAAGIVAAAILLGLATWKNLVDSLFIGLTGRKWIIQGTVFAGVTAFCVLCFLAGWIYKHPETHATTFAVLPWLLGLLALCKLLLAGWAARQTVRRGLLAPATLKRWALAWLLLASVLFGILAWVVPPQIVPWYYLGFAVLFALPTARLAATPLVLAWNRHR